MFRILLIIITVATLFKNVANCSFAALKSVAATVSEEHEEGKPEKTQDKGGKEHNDQVHDYHVHDIPDINSSLSSSAPFSDQKNYCGFHDRPNTPPPNRI